MKKWMIIIQMWLIPSGIMAQSNFAELKADTTLLRLGQQTLFTFDISCKKDLTPILPDWKTLFDKKLDIIQEGSLDTLSDATSPMLKLHQEMVVAKFTEDTVFIAPDSIALIKKRDTSWLYVEPLVLYPIFENVDMKHTFRDIKGPEDIPFAWQEMMPYIIMFLGLLLLILLIIIGVKLVKKFRRKPKAVEVVEVPEVKVPAHEIAMVKLRRMRELEEWNTEASKQYTTKLTEVIREYIANRWDFYALESTSTEILAGDYINNISHEHLSILKEMLSMADMVKFAKATTSTDDNKLLLDKSILFVESTREIEGTDSD